MTVSPRVRLLLILAVIPLTAFQCVPSPLVRVSIDDPPAKAIATVSGVPEAYERAVVLGRSFAHRFALTSYSDRCTFGHYALGPGGKCSGFARFKEEGILLEILYSPESRATMIFVVKEARVFAEHTKARVYDEFNEQIVSPLVIQFGREHVNVQQ